MQPRGSRSGKRSLAKAVVAGLLILLLVFAAAFSVNHAAHRFDGKAGTGGHHLCLLCSMAKGQVSAADPVLVSVILALALFCGAAVAKNSTQAQFEHRLAPIRGPPSRYSSVAVVG